MTLSEYIIQYRAEHGLSQRQLAQAVGVSNVYISMLEKNQNKDGKPISPSLETVIAIAKATGKKTEELLDLVDDFEISIEKPEEKEKSDAPTLNIVARGAKNMPMPDEDLKRRYFEFTFGDQLKEKEKESTLPDGLTEDNIDDVFMQILVQNRNKEQILEFAKKLIEKAIEL